MIETLYHVTRSANVESITVHGILPVGDDPDRIESGMTSKHVIRDEPWRKNTVWLTHDPSAVYDQMTFGSRHDVVVVVDAADLPVSVRDKYFNSKNEPIEYLVEGAIPPERIKEIKSISDFGKEIAFF